MAPRPLEGVVRHASSWSHRRPYWGCLRSNVCALTVLFLVRQQRAHDGVPVPSMVFNKAAWHAGRAPLPNRAASRPTPPHMLLTLAGTLLCRQSPSLTPADSHSEKWSINGPAALVPRVIVTRGLKTVLRQFGKGFEPAVSFETHLTTAKRLVPDLWKLFHSLVSVCSQEVVDGC